MRRAAERKEPRRDVLSEGKLSDYRSRGKHLPRCVVSGVRIPNEPRIRTNMLVGLQQGESFDHLNWRGQVISWGKLTRASSAALPARIVMVSNHMLHKKYTSTYKRHCLLDGELQKRRYIYTQEEH